MKQFLSSLLWDLKLQYRYYFWMVGLVVTLMWLLLLFAVSENAKATWIPVLIFADIGNIGLLFIAGILYLERRQGTLYVAAIMPVPRANWLTVKLVNLTVLCTACAIVIVLFNDDSVSWARIVPAAVLSGSLFTSIGFLLALPFDRILNYFLGMALVLTLLNIPILYHLDIISSEWMWLIPSHAALQLLAGSFQEISLTRYLATLIVLVGWVLLAHSLSIRLLQRFTSLRPQA